MRSTPRKVHWLVALFMFASLGAASLHASTGPDNRARLSPLAGNRPLAFEENRGQTDPRVKYLARGNGSALFFTPAEAVLALRGSILRIRWSGGSPAPRMSAEGQLPGVTNYLTGSDLSRWRTGVPSWKRIHYEEVWPGIDLVFYGNPKQLEHDVVVAPGADPGRVRLAFDGAEELRIDPAGDLVARVGGEEVRLHRPLSYQEDGGVRREVESGWRLAPGGREAGFRVAAYDRSKPLVIDPVLAYSTYLGGNLDDGSYGGTADAQGNLYATGSTNSPDFPLATPFQSSLGGNYDVFVTKIDPSGALVYSTYLGGSDGEQGEDMAADDHGHVVLAGYTFSPDFPRVGGLPTALAGGEGDAFIVELGPAGEVLFSTLLGGSGGDAGYGVGIDDRGRVYVGGTTRSSDFPVHGGLYSTPRGDEDVFVARLSPSGAELEAATYLGGSGRDYVLGMAVDPAGHVYLPGFTTSRDLPLVHPVVGTWPGGPQDWSTVGFVAKLEPSLASLVYSTWFANGWDVAADSAGNTYVIGLPQPSSAGDVCASKLDPDGDLLFSSCFGGSSREEGAANIEVDRRGNIILAGNTASADFPVKNPIQDHCASFGSEGYEGIWIPDIFVTKLDATGREILFSTCLGGSRPMRLAFYPPDEGVYGLGVDARGDIYLAGWTYSADFPAVNAVQPEHGGGSPDGEIDAIAARISLNAPPACSAAIVSPAVIWPPNGKLVPLKIEGVTDPDDDPVTLQITRITQDEPLSGRNPDATGIGTSAASVRATRDSAGDGRVYHVSFEARDSSEASCTGTVTVCVPHDQGRGTCGDGGALVDSSGGR